MWKTGVDDGENSTDDDVTEKLQNNVNQDYRETQNMTDEDVQLGQLNNNTTFYDREGKATCASHVIEQITVSLHIQNHVPTTFIPHACMHAFSSSPLDAVGICLVYHVNTAVIFWAPITYESSYVISRFSLIYIA